MSDYVEVREFLLANNVTHEDMQHMWITLSNTNWKVRNLIACGKDWTDLNTHALKSLIEQYEKLSKKE